ncbi:MAG: hypothetical protein RIQ95_185, partial [Pseudomonadota bacterium]
MILIQTTEQAAVQLANDSLLSHLGGLEAWLRPLLHW